jgi:pyruvate dehydrogenase E2 component (dihydrolipoamide acetyltransferase)
MARWEFKLPDIGEGITEGEIVGWLVKPGDAVKEDQPMVEVMTDKATVTITAPRAGVVLETRGGVGDIVKVHAILVVFDLDDRAAVSPRRTNGTSAHPSATEEPAATVVRPIRDRLPINSALPSQPSAGSDLAGYFNEKPLATPATRKFARDMSVDLRRVPPTGPQSRVTKRDVEAFVSSSVSPSTEIGNLAAGPPPRAASDLVHDPASPSEERVPLAGLRRRIAQNVARSKATAAHFTFVEECDVTELKAWRAQLRETAQARGAKLNFLPFIVKAVVASLKRHPMLNATLDEATNEIVFRRYYHIGIATATQAGLVVPVVRDADQKSILDIARDVERLAQEARAGKAKLEELHGSTFTITSLGAQAGLFATPIINFPEVAILGVHKIKSKPVVRAGQIAIGDVMLLSLSFDHRLVDGHVGAAFAYEVIEYLEHPERLLLEMT